MTIMTTAEFRAKHGPSPLSGKVLITSGQRPVPQSKTNSHAGESKQAQDDPMAPVAQGIEDWLATKFSTEAPPKDQSKP
jgi:hypothetical protein